LEQYAILLDYLRSNDPDFTKPTKMMCGEYEVESGWSDLLLQHKDEVDRRLAERQQARAAAQE